MTLTLVRPVLSKRCVGIDRLRGVAISLMILDHLFIITHAPTFTRLTITRLAMPLFFLISGHLAKRVSWRLPVIGFIGLLIPAVAIWIDSPNVLFWFAVLAPIVVLIRDNRVITSLVILFALTFSTNRYSLGIGSSYDPIGLFAIMCFGTLIKRESFNVFNRLPAFFGKIGHYPMTIYISHLVILGALT